MAPCHHYSVLLSLIVSLLRPCFAVTATTNPAEVESLQIISRKMGLSTWNFSVDPCTQNTGPSFIICSCSNSSCHISELHMDDANLSGSIPTEIANFTRLQRLTMERNFLSGTFPVELCGLNFLTFLNIGINQLSGHLPPEIGNLTNLQKLYIGTNNFSGGIPAEIGNLILLAEMHVDGSGFSGEIPMELGQLTNLQNLWMFDNNFQGQIPNVFAKMLTIGELLLYGNENLTGPIPSSILNLGSLITLSIGDLSDGGQIPSNFKSLQKLTYLSLRHNGLVGSIPEDIGNVDQLQYLDLSFNKLTGHIPAFFSNLMSLSTLFLGNNKLEGNIDVLGKLSNLKILDVSKNQFSGTLPSWVTSLSLQLNLLWNHFDQTIEKTRLVAATFNCLTSLSQCIQTSSGRNGGFAINCGGPNIQTNQSIFSSDGQSIGDASYIQSDDGRWGLSNIGMQDTFSTIVQTPSIISNTFEQELYQTARGSPSSLTYYGLGMFNGQYKVELHFAEISITSNNTWQSLGQRLFDIFIQGSRVEKDFDIRAAANGSFSAVVKTYPANVTQNVLEIHLLWAGKGTCCVPQKWTYGPLISAVRVIAEFEIPKSASSRTQKLAAILGSAMFVAVLMIGCILYCVMRRRKKLRACNFQNQAFMDGWELPCLEVKPQIFTYNQIRIATENFHEKNKLGQGGSGDVYKGSLGDGTMVAIKQLFRPVHRENQEFLNEVGTISAVQHRNLVKLLGCCVEENRRILVLEFLENNSLSQALFGKNIILDWSTRFTICIQIAQGLAYLHEESRIRIVHRDIKASNILLDRNLNAKIADFGLAKLFGDDKIHITTRVAGTIGYLDPEYAIRGKLTEKADVYSFGILLLEILSGRRNIDTHLPAEKIFVREWAWQLYDEMRLEDLADKTLEGNFVMQEFTRTAHVALLCAQSTAEMRPKVSEALSMLTGSLDIKLNINRSGFSADHRQLLLEDSISLPLSSGAHGLCT